MLRTIIYVYVNIILDFPITYRNASVLSQSECTCLHQTVYMVHVVFFTKYNEITYPKERALMQMYRVVPSSLNKLHSIEIIVDRSWDFEFT